MPPAGFEPAIPASERLKTHALDGVATETSVNACYFTLTGGFIHIYDKYVTDTLSACKIQTKMYRCSFKLNVFSLRFLTLNSFHLAVYVVCPSKFSVAGHLSNK
jgi:hypothetical protein